MKKAISAAVLLLVFLLSSCWPVYRQVQDKGKPTVIDPIVTDDYTINISLHQRYFEDGADCYVQLYLVPHKDLQFKAGDIQVALEAIPEEKSYVLKNTYHFKRETIDGVMKKWTMANTPKIDDSQTLHLVTGNYYFLVYAFSGKRHRKMKIDVGIHINGKSVNRSFVVKKHTEVELFH
jgi:hypothetical protein